MELSSNFSFAIITSSGTKTNSVTAPSSVSSAPTTAVDAAVKAGGYLGYIALLCNEAESSTVTPANYNYCIQEIQRVRSEIQWNLLPLFSGQTGSDFQALVSDINTMQKNFGYNGGAAPYSAFAVPTDAQMAAYSKIYEDTSTVAASPVGNILTLLQNHENFDMNTDSDTYFAVTMFLLSGNLPGVLKTGLSADLESILGQNAGFTGSGTWMADFLSAYIVAKSPLHAGLQGSLIAAILPDKGSTGSTTPNYDAFYNTFTGNSSISYSKWTAPSGLTSQQALNGVSYWYSSVLP